MATTNSAYPLFSVYGIELEYMIVDKDTLEIKPIADKVLEQLAGHLTNETEIGEIGISNELALHVIEFKTATPAPSLTPLSKQFKQTITEVNRLLLSYNAQLMPTGMHPWLNPHKGVSLWPHGDRKIYETYHRIFNCMGHGWGNLQSTHINLPFSNDEEFAKLHNAIRLVLPLIPALTASTPFAEGKPSGVMDTRLLFYGQNQKKIPIISGRIIPEFIPNIESYHRMILQPIYQAIAPFDTEGVLQHEWLNSRGFISRFERNAIEIRVLDIQEAPKADLACTAGIVAVCKYIINTLEEYLNHPIEIDELFSLYIQSIKLGTDTPIESKLLCQQLGISSKTNLTAATVWSRLLELSSDYLDNTYGTALEKILINGNLAQRLMRAYTHNTDLVSLYQMLNQCLEQNELFMPTTQ